MTASSRGAEPLVRAIGTLGLAAAIVNVTVGGGIFRLPAIVAASLGAAAPLAYGVCAVAMSLIVACMADAGRRVPLTGGPYAFVGAAFGPYVGFLSGFLLWMIGTFACAAVSTVFASNVGALIPALSGRAMAAVMLACVLAFWSAINMRGVAFASRLNGISTAAKLVPLLLLAIGGLAFVDPAKLAWSAPPVPGDVARTSLLLIFAFAGIEAAIVPGGEVRDPARTIPRAIALAMCGIAGMYILLQVVAQGILGDALASSTVAPLADAAGASLGGWARSLLLVGAALSMFGYLCGMTLSMPRMLYAFGRDGFLPRPFGQVHPRFRTPHVAIVAQSAVTLALAVTGTFERLAILANVSALALYFGCAAAAWRLRSTPIVGGGTAALPAFVPGLTCLVILWLLTSVAAAEWLALVAAIAVATLVYLVIKRPAPATSPVAGSD